MRRGAWAGVVALAVLWPGVGAAQEPPPDTTVAPTTTAPPSTTVPEPAPTTAVPDPAPPTEAVPEVEPEVEATPEGTTGERTLRVRPHLDLVDAQVVVVRGQGWRPNGWVIGAMQCRAGVPGVRGCGGDRYEQEIRTDARGNFRLEFEVQTVLETPAGTWDCRVAACVVRAFDPRLEGASRSVRLEFDPAGPDPVREEASVSPATDLVDGQIVTVVAEDFDAPYPWGGVAELVECRLPVTDRDDCDATTRTATEYARDGYVAQTYRLEALLRIDGADVDCRTSDCALLVADSSTGLPRAAIVPLDFDPAAPLGPPPTVTVEPATDLRDGQVVDIDGVGLRARGDLILAQCRWGAEDLSACSIDDIGYGKVRADGTFHTQLGVRAVLHTGRDRSRVNCRVTACSLTAFSGYYDGYEEYAAEGHLGGPDLERIARTRLHYRPNAPLLSPSITTPDLDGVRAGSRWRIWGTRGRPEGTVVLLQCRAGAQTTAACAQGTRHHIHVHFEPRARVGMAWEARFRFQRHLHLTDGRQVDCAAVACVLVAMDHGGGLEQSDRIATRFAT